MALAPFTPSTPCPISYLSPPTASSLSSESRRKVLPLLDLPTAVLRHIARHTSGQDSKSLRATCCALRAVTCPPKLNFNITTWKDAALDPFGDEFMFSKGEWLRLSDSELALLRDLRDSWQESAHSMKLVCEDLSFGSNTTLGNLLDVEGAGEESKGRDGMVLPDTGGALSHSSEKCLVRKDSPSQVAARYQHKVLLTLHHWAPLLRHVEMPCLSPLVQVLAKHCPCLSSLVLSPPAFAAPPTLPTLWHQPVAPHQGLMPAQLWGAGAQQHGQDWQINWMENPIDELDLDFAPVPLAVRQGMTAAARGLSHLTNALQALSSCTALRALSITGWKCSLETTCDSLAKLTQLQSLCVQCHGPKHYGNWGQSLAKLTSLTCLRMLPPFGCPPLRMDRWADQPGQFQGQHPDQGTADTRLQLGALTGLRILDAWGAGHVADLSKCSLLRSLRMSWVPHVVLMNMKHLRFWCGWTLDDDSAHALSHCPLLVRVEVWFVTLTARSTGVILPELRELLVKTSYRNKFALESSLLELAPNLQKLALPEHYCTLGCLRDHPNLSHLLLPLWTLFSPDAQAHALQSLSALTHLNVEGDVCLEVAPSLSAAASSQALTSATSSSSHADLPAVLNEINANVGVPPSLSDQTSHDADSATPGPSYTVSIPAYVSSPSTPTDSPCSSPALSTSSLSSLPSFLSSPNPCLQLSSYLSPTDMPAPANPSPLLLSTLPNVKVLSIRVQDVKANNPSNCIGHLLCACPNLSSLTLEFRDQSLWTCQSPDKLLQNMLEQQVVWAAQHGALRQLRTVKVGLRVPAVVFDQGQPMFDQALQYFDRSNSAVSEALPALNHTRQASPLLPGMFDQFFSTFDRSASGSKSTSLPKLVKVLTAIIGGLARAAASCRTTGGVNRVELLMDFLGKVPSEEMSVWKQVSTACERAGSLPFEVVLVDQGPSVMSWNEPRWDY